MRRWKRWGDWASKSCARMIRKHRRNVAIEAATFCSCSPVTFAKSIIVWTYMGFRWEKLEQIIFDSIKDLNCQKSAHQNQDVKERKRGREREKGRCDSCSAHIWRCLCAHDNILWIQHRLMVTTWAVTNNCGLIGIWKYIFRNHGVPNGKFGANRLVEHDQWRISRVILPHT